MIAQSLCFRQPIVDKQLTGLSPYPSQRANINLLQGNLPHIWVSSKTGTARLRVDHEEIRDSKPLAPETCCQILGLGLRYYYGTIEQSLESGHRPNLKRRIPYGRRFWSIANTPMAHRSQPLGARLLLEPSRSPFDGLLPPMVEFLATVLRDAWLKSALDFPIGCYFLDGLPIPHC